MTVNGTDLPMYSVKETKRMVKALEYGKTPALRESDDENRRAYASVIGSKSGAASMCSTIRVVPRKRTGVFVPVDGRKALF